MNAIPPPPPLPRLLETKSYERSMTYWKCPRITIVSADDKPIAHIPINFVVTGGDNTWGYVVRVAREMVIENDGWIFDRGQPVNLADQPFAGTFVYSSQGDSTYFRCDPSAGVYAYPAGIFRLQHSTIRSGSILHHALQASRY